MVETMTREPLSAGRRLRARIEAVNKELWVVLSLFVIALVLNHLVASQSMVLSFYVLPTIGSAYFYGRNHATLTAFASVLLVAGLMLFNDATALQAAQANYDKWLEVV